MLCELLLQGRHPSLELCVVLAAQFLLMRRKGSKGGFGVWATATHLGDEVHLLGFWLGPDSASGLEAVWGASQKMGAPHSLSLILSPFL